MRLAPHSSRTAYLLDLIARIDTILPESLIAGDTMKPVRASNRESVLLLGFLLSTACDDARVAPLEVNQTEVSAYLTETARIQVDSNGNLILPDPVSPDPSQPILSPSDALQLAVAFVQQGGPLIRRVLEQDHGQPIDFQLLVPGRIYYAETPYTGLPTDAHPGYRRRFGPYYVVDFRTGARSVLSIAVAAYASDLGLENGRVSFPVFHGNEFKFQASLPTLETTFPVTPEQAVASLALASNTRANAVPRLVLPSRKHVPKLAMWRTTLERAVVAVGRSTQALYLTSEAFVNHRGEFYLAVDSSRVREVYFTRDRQLVGIEMPLRPGYAIQYEQVDFSSEDR